MTDAWWLLLAVLFPVWTGLATLWLPRTWVSPRVGLALLGPASAFGLILACLRLESEPGATQATDVLPWVPDFHLNVAFLADGLGGFFGLLVSGVGVLIVLYARGYFGGHSKQARDDLYRFLPTLGFFCTAMLGVVLADFTLLTLVFWELTSVSSFLLIGWDRTKPGSVKLATQAFVTTGLGGMFLLGGLALFGGATGVWRWSELGAASAGIDWSSGPVVLAFLLMLVGAFAKSAQWPLHYWLPGAMAAPTPVSAYLHSATMVKAGVFLVGRLYPEFQVVGDGTLWAAVLIPFGTVTMLYGGITAVCKHDLKQVFAYTTVSQLGLLLAMYGLGGLHYVHDGHQVAALDFDLTQIANHAFYKAPLFILAGAIGHVASRQLPELFGAFRKHPAICGLMLAAGWALAALPGSISFQAKELFLQAVVHAAAERPWVWAVLAATVVTAACNVAIFVRLATTLLGWRFGLRKDRESQAIHEHHAHVHGFGAALIWLPAVPLVALQFIGGLFPGVWDAVFLRFETHVNHAGFHGHVPSLWHAVTHPGWPLLASAVAIGLGVALGLSPLLRRAHRDGHDHLYPALTAGITGLGTLARRSGQTGNLRHYVLFTFAFCLIGFGAAAWRQPAMFEAVGPSLGTLWESPVGVFLAVLICVTAVMLPLIKPRVVRVLILGACGFAVVGMYVLFQAPDLALTQLFFEIISVLLFVLVLRMLPTEKDCPDPSLWLRIPVATLMGLAMGWVTLLAAGAEPAERLGDWFIRNTYQGGPVDEALGGGYGHGGGGYNIVNVILVDFRGFDTLGEISVLGLAALGVWSMLAGRGKPTRVRRDRRRGLARLVGAEAVDASGSTGEPGGVGGATESEASR